ncbi:MAG TPA: YdcF family protein [Alphaproteobacteria bacterium]
MFFTFSKLFWFFAAPSQLLVMLTMLTLALLCRKKTSARIRKCAHGMGIALIIAYAMLFTLPVGDWAIFPLEAKAPPAMKIPARIDGIVILGAALDENITEYHGVVAINGQAERLIFAVPLIKHYPQAKIVYAGGSPQGNLQREADLAKIVFQMWGINTSKFVFERDSRNTYENIVNVKKAVKPNGDQNWLLMTSAAHMPRAMAIAQHLNWEMIPYPVDYQSGGWIGLSGGNIRYNLDRLDRAVQEYIGMIAYKLTDKA